jgi:hypothetical protein
LKTTEDLKSLIWKWFKFKHNGDKELLGQYRMLFDTDDGMSLLEHQALTLEETLDMIDTELSLWLEDASEERD